LIFVLEDAVDPKQDELISRFILNRNLKSAQPPGERSTCCWACSTAFVDCALFCAFIPRVVLTPNVVVPFSLEKLKAYIALVQARFYPELSDAAKLVCLFVCLFVIVCVFVHSTYSQHSTP
jgi:DNA replicative helicase MCM subunit Mcm2 (Cdc46/Mcm family)